MSDIAVQSASTELEIDYETESLTLIGNYTQISFEIEPKETILLPACKSLIATQKKNKLNEKTIKSKCKVYKNKEIIEGFLINHKTALNEDTSFVLVFDGKTTIKVNKPDKILFTDECVEIKPKINRDKVNVLMVLEKAILFEFKHLLTQNGEDYFLETILVLNNESKYTFKNNNKTKILVPIDSEESSNGVNITMNFNDIGTINPFSKESIVITSMNLMNPLKYYLLSLLNPHILQECIEFTLPEMLCPGEVTYMDEKEFSNIFSTGYTAKGEKLQVYLDKKTDLNIVCLDNSEDFSLILDLAMDMKIKIKEFNQVKYIMLDNILCLDDTLFIEKGRHTISGKY